MKIYHNSQELSFRSPFGAAEIGSGVKISIKITECSENVKCALIVYDRNGSWQQEMVPERITKTPGGFMFSTEIRLPSEPGLIFYAFMITDGIAGSEEKLFYQNASRLGGEGAVCDSDPIPYQITVYKYDKVPDWYKEAIVYQIFPDRFARGGDWMAMQEKAYNSTLHRGASRGILQDWNDMPYYQKDSDGNVTRWVFSGGNLEGIRSKLQYIKSIGATAVYLNPIFKARSNHKYDTGDYMKIDEAFGDEETFELLCKEAGKMGINIILDGVFSHTGADSIYFNRYENYDSVGACQGKESPYYDWYSFRDNIDDYECWWGVKDLPNVNELTPSYRKYIFEDDNSVIRKWLRLGAKGWRLDVADELPDEFIKGIRKAMRETDPDAILLGEVWEDASNKEAYGKLREYFWGDELQSTMNYPFRLAALDYMLGRINAPEFAARMMSLKENYPPENFYGALNLIGSHDRTRIFTLLGDAPFDLPEEAKATYRLPDDKADLAKKRLKVLTLLQFTFPGVPSIYYGDETGMEGFEDPYNRGTFPWGNTDDDLNFHFRFMGMLRKEYPVLVNGDFECEALSGHVFSCRRKDKKEEIITLVNRGIFEWETVTVAVDSDKKGDSYRTANDNANEDANRDADVNIDGYNGDKYVLDLLTSREYKIANGEITLTLPPLGAVLLYVLPSEPIRHKLTGKSGILCHISSVPGGNLGKGARRTVDFIADSGNSLWQILPVCPTDDANSPYNSPSVFAGNTKFIDQGDTSADTTLYEGFCLNEEICSNEGFCSYEEFCEKNSFWLEDHAFFMALREKYGSPWQSWPENVRDHPEAQKIRDEFAAGIDKEKQAQYVFALQWEALKKYAHSRNIKIFGDIPIFASGDSADVWAHPEYFMLEEDGKLKLTGGAPPDGFTPEGQNWMLPVYNWNEMGKDGFQWWKERIAQALKRFDYIRLDHFRGFSAYYTIPSGGTGKDGQWFAGPGKKLFEALSEGHEGMLPIIAEDLGILDAGVYNLLKLSGFPGMRVWQFNAEEMEAMDEETAANYVFYSGTHDNETLAGWCENVFADRDPKRAAAEIIEKLYYGKAPWVIMPIQDVLLLDNSHRMNRPGTIEGNWGWKLDESLLSEDTAKWLHELNVKSGRI